MTLPRASRSLISPVVTETERQKKAKELLAQSSPSPLLLCVPLASSQCWAGPGQSSCRLPCAHLAVIHLSLLGRGGVEGGGRDGGAGWGVEKRMCCTVGASQKVVERERALFCNERKERGRCWEDVCGIGLRICIHKQRMGLRVLFSACCLSLGRSPAGFFSLLFC